MIVGLLWRSCGVAYFRLFLVVLAGRARRNRWLICWSQLGCCVFGSSLIALCVFVDNGCLRVSSRDALVGVMYLN